VTSFLAYTGYTKYYIGFWVKGKPLNFAVCKPQKNALRLEIRLPKIEEYDEIIFSSSLDIDYDNRWDNYHLRLTKKDAEDHHDTIKDLLQKAYELRK